MRKLQPLLAVVCVWLQAVSPLAAQAPAQTPAQAPASRAYNAVNDDTLPRLEEGGHWYSRFQYPYMPRTVPPVNVSNSLRMESLMRAGNIYLSLRDAIALALENNLDIEVTRYEFSYANVDLLRTRA